jgi:hypothetical protein
LFREFVTVFELGLSRREILTRYGEYCNWMELKVVSSGGHKGIRRAVMKPVLNLFHGVPNGKQFRVNMDELVKKEDLPIGDAILKAAECISAEVLDAF